MVQAYIAKYGGSASDINADVAEAYSVGEVVDQAVTPQQEREQREAHQLPAQRRHAAERAGPGQVQRPRREPGGDRVHLPVAERQVRSGPAGQRGRVRSRSSTRSRTGPAETGRCTERHGAEMARQIYEAIVDGILGGGVYALMAVGLTLIFGVLDIINIAQGILVVLGAYLSYVLSVHLHIDLFARPADHRAGDVRHRRGHPRGVHPAAARPGAHLDVAAGLLRGRDHHRGDPVPDLRARHRRR